MTADVLDGALGAEDAEPRAGDVRDLREVEHDVVPVGGAAGEVRVQRGPERGRADVVDGAGGAEHESVGEAAGGEFHGASRYSMGAI